jgi:phosphatidylinositol glycan class W
MVLSSPKDDYKHAKEAFVSGTTGSTVSHVNMISLAALVCSRFSFHVNICLLQQASIALHSAIRSRFPPHNSFRFLSEWLLLVIPLLLSMTLFADRPGTLSVALILPTVLICGLFAPHQSGTPLPSGSNLSPRGSPTSPNVPDSHNDQPTQMKTTSAWMPEMTRLPALSTYRAHMMLMTVLAILAVDFRVFPRALAKCETYGVSFVRPVFLLFYTPSLL